MNKANAGRGPGPGRPADTGRLTIRDLLEQYLPKPLVVVVHPKVWTEELDQIVRRNGGELRTSTATTTRTAVVIDTNRLGENLLFETSGGIREPSSLVRAVSQPEDETAGA